MNKKINLPIMGMQEFAHNCIYTCRSWLSLNYRVVYDVSLMDMWNGASFYRGTTPRF